MVHKMFTLRVTPRLPFGKSPTKSIPTLPLNPLSKLLTAKQTLEDVFSASSVATVIWLTAPIFKSPFQKSIN